MAVVADEQPPVLCGSARPGPLRRVDGIRLPSYGFGTHAGGHVLDPPPYRSADPASPRSIGYPSGVWARSRRSATSESKTEVAPASSSSCSLKPPINTPIVGTPVRLADSQSQVESPTITASPPPAFSTAAATRSGSGLVFSTSADVVQPSTTVRASSRSR